MEIAAKEDRLMKLTQGAAPPSEPVSETKPVPSAAPTTPLELPTSSRFKVTEFNY